MKIDDRQFFRITNYIKQKYGVNLSSKRDFVEKRLERLMEETHCQSVDEFTEAVEYGKNEELNARLISSMATSYTYFLRESLHFELLTDVVLPKLYKRGNTETGIKVWSAASSSGEEAYSILMTVLDFMKEEAKDWKIEVVGTDISKEMLKRAEIGEYSKIEVEKLPEEWIRAYFTPKIDGGYRINDFVKEKAVFYELNLVSEFEFEKTFHVIFLRNILSYFESGLANQIVDKIADYLEVGGYLFIGIKEEIRIVSHKLICVQPSVYRKI
ncbi:CheR family methyltransferase [Konateibacter massiliensis]|uniref:CheR family methyltransferase n=1 Tax=Konateibacter massiliensis TaxID=2002841 RepID=UPI000C156BAC|nr:protein-glutamate O-methyltransferase CheR [Konateibacter massiliensis]